MDMQLEPTKHASSLKMPGTELTSQQANKLTKQRHMPPKGHAKNNAIRKRMQKGHAQDLDTSHAPDTCHKKVHAKGHARDLDTTRVSTNQIQRTKHAQDMGMQLEPHADTCRRKNMRKDNCRTKGHAKDCARD